MDSNLIICDEYVQGVGSSCANRGKRFDEIMDFYIVILREIAAEAIVAGELAEALGEFIQCVVRLRTQLTDISENVHEACQYYIVDINDADSFLF